MPARYSLGIQVLAMAAFSLAFVGWLNETWLFWFENPIWLNRYTEYLIILCFGLWRIWAEKNSYTRRRLIILVSVVTGLWWLIPWLYPVFEPYIGFLWGQPVFPALHVPGTISFFLVLALVFLFGRRVICGFGCPCVGIRETVGFAFRDRTPRSKWTWRLRHTKWFFFVYYVGVMVVTQFPPNAWTVSFVGGFYLIVALTYFGTFMIAPLVGNRFYCRYLCPYGATFGLLNHAGYYGINMKRENCNDCRRCEQVCDMGIPVWEQGKQAGRVTAIEDCMGCARCVVSCPTDALEIRDVRNLFRPKLVQNASHLMKKKIPVAPAREEQAWRPAAQRRADWREITLPTELAMIQQQAARCLDCGVPGCSNACPLHNRIPEWLEAVAAGEIEKAATISHATSNLPDICGRLCPQHRLCEGACTKANEPGGAVTIGLAERFITDEAFKRGWRPELGRSVSTDKHIAIVGAGPAGLACADELSKAGCRVSVYDKQTVVGGLMATGVPPFKLEKGLLRQRRALLEEKGVAFKLGIEVDEARLQQMLQAHDAVFLATGAQISRALCLPEPERTERSETPLAGVLSALDYLARVNTQNGATELADKRVVVLGGGDSAMDCARAALRQGAASVTVAYRGKETAMRASPKEKQAAQEEGVHFLFEHQPEAVLGEQAVRAIRFTDQHLACDVLICALGQMAEAPAWLQRLGVAVNERGEILVDANGRTSQPKIFAGGDNTHGPDLVVTAIAAGRTAASGILNSLHPAKQLLQRARLYGMAGRNPMVGQPVATSLSGKPS